VTAEDLDRDGSNAARDAPPEEHSEREWGVLLSLGLGLFLLLLPVVIWLCIAVF